MKKTVTAIVAGAFLFSLAGCSKKTDESVTTESTEVSTDVMGGATAVTTDVETEVPTDSAS